MYANELHSRFTLAVAIAVSIVIIVVWMVAK
jgi:hypothetical protein